MVKIENEIQMLDVSTLVPYGKNNKKHLDAQISLLAEHISTHGWDVPIVVDEKMSILKGHGRLLAAKKLGLDKVPVIVRHGLTEVQKKALRIADNKLTELAEWDKLNLDSELADLLTDGVDLSSLGFPDFSQLENDDFEFKLKDKSEKEVTFTASEKLCLQITCANADDQETMFSELKRRGYRVKVV